jgi:SfnB family sulfur acquisition oxidoreductase
MAAVASEITTHEQAVSAARGYAASIAEGAIERDRAGTVPFAALAALDASGLLAITIPREYGGAGLSAVSLTEVIREIAKVDPAIAQSPQGHFLMVDVLAVYGTEAQRERLFTEVLNGGRIGSALAERGNVHAQDLTTRLRGADGDQELDGRKYYCTGGITSRWLAVTALDDRDQLVLAFVERDAPGVTMDEDWHVMGQRATVSGGAGFDGVAVDPELILPYHDVFTRPQQLGARAQLVHAAIQAGIARGALEDAGGFVRDKARPSFEAVRAGWGDAAGGDPHTVLRYGRMATKVRAAETLLADAAVVQDDIGLRPADEHEAARGSIAVAQAKAFASEVAVEVASDLFALTGASAADERYDFSRHWRNARTHASHDPADWKYHHAGDFLLNGVLPPNHPQL